MEEEFGLHRIYIFFMLCYRGFIIRFSRGLVSLTFKSTKLRWIFTFNISTFIEFACYLIRSSFFCYKNVVLESLEIFPRYTVAVSYVIVISLISFKYCFILIMSTVKWLRLILTLIRVGFFKVVFSGGHFDPPSYFNKN